MANKLLVIGESGSGKSTSTRNLDPASTFFINVIGKPLPFKGWQSKYTDYNKPIMKGNLFKTHNSDEICACMHHISGKLPHIKTIIIDDAQYIMSYEFMERAQEKGYDKFIEIGKHMFDVFTTPDKLRDDITVVFLMHSDDITANGYTKTKVKTIGKMLDEKITIEGLFTIVLLSVCYKNNEKEMCYSFVTKSNGMTTAKTPDGMFKYILIENDLKFVLDKITEYNK